LRRGLHRSCRRIKRYRASKRPTAKRLWERLQAAGFTGGYTIVKAVVRGRRPRQQEVLVPLVHAPGEAQVDFGEALVQMNGVLRKVAFFVLALPYSEAPFVMAFERECTETFWAGQGQAFEFFGGGCRGGSATTTRRWRGRRSSAVARAGA
jgi:transposase